MFSGLFGRIARHIGLPAGWRAVAAGSCTRVNRPGARFIPGRAPGMCNALFPLPSAGRPAQ
ncbi:hypothetical protein L665_02078 [Ralstonia solanacearum SD54]|nr:hypothetical protein L665_02078 [Ralstonia solanacearum SD54]